MSVSLPNGSLVSICSGYGASKTMATLSNASPAVAGVTANGYSNGDFVEVTSGWSRLTNKIVRVSAAATDSFSLEGIDATLTSIYPASGGAGSVRKISGWTQLAQILNSTSQGGDQQFLTYQFLEADAQVRIPTFKNPYGLDLEVADDPAGAGYLLAVAANDDRLARAIKIVLPNGGILLYNAYVSVNKTPSLTVNELMAVKVTLSLLAEPVRY
jgi:hypothetical protein